MPDSDDGAEVAEAIAQVRAWVEQSHGHRIGMIRQKTQEGNPKESVHYGGQARAYLTVLKTLKHIEETGEMPEWESQPLYADVSQAMQHADEMAKEANSFQEKGLE